jgi:tetratricopeptide (TPR) repeat protein
MTAMQHLGLPALALAFLLSAPGAPRAQELVDEAGDQVGAVPVVGDDVAMLRLKSGGILWGSIASHDEEGIRFHRLDNGGVVGLRWSFLDPEEEHGLRTRFGYVESGVDEIMVEADLIRLVDGSERVGLITERTGSEIWLKTAEGRLPIPLQRISGPSSVVQVPALDVYTKEELYQQRLSELSMVLLSDAPEAAVAHFQVAQFCEQLYDYEKALQHYEAAARVDPTFEADSMPVILERVTAKASVQAQVDMLQQIDLWRARRHYDKAFRSIAQFVELYPDSPLIEDLNKLRERVGKYQERDLREEAVRSWHHWTRRLASTAARKMGYQEALAYLDGGMGEDILKKVHEDLQGIAPEIPAEEARRLWEERSGGKVRQASYGNGTWLLGESAARAGIETEEAAETEKGTQADARRLIDEKVQRYLKNQQIARKAQAGGRSEDEDPDAFWGTFPSPNRVQWVLAYYVENSGDFHLQRARFRNCRECGGTGTRSIVYTGGAVSGAVSGERLVPCPTCKQLGVVRMIKYR